MLIVKEHGHADAFAMYKCICRPKSKLLAGWPLNVVVSRKTGETEHRSVRSHLPCFPAGTFASPSARSINSAVQGVALDSDRIP